MSDALLRLLAVETVFPALAWGACRVWGRLAAWVRCALWWGVCAQLLAGALFAALRWLDAGALWGGWGWALLTLWGLGLAWRGWLLRWQFQWARRLVRSGVPAPDGPLRDAVRSLSARLGLSHAPPILVCAGLSSPVLAGIRRPVLLVPVAALSDTISPELAMAMAHELAHLRRRDLWAGLVPVLAQSLLFFHPLVHFAVREYTLAREEACDSEARHVTATAPDQYGAMLLHYVVAARRPVGTRRRVGSCFHTFVRRLNTMRIPYEQPRQGAGGALCCALILGSVCVSALWLATPDPVTPRRVDAVPRPVPVREARLVPPVSASLLPPVEVARPVHAAHRLPVIAKAAPVRRVIWKRVRPVSVVKPVPVTPVKPVHRTAPPAPPVVLAAQPADTANSDRVILVASSDADAPPPMPSDFPADLSQMRSDLQSLRDQLRQQGMTLPDLSKNLPDPASEARLRAQVESEFGPSFRAQQEAQAQQLRAQLDAELPHLRALAEQSAREAARAQSQSAQAQRLAAQARAQALQELRREMPRLREEIRQSLPAAPIPPPSPDAPAF